VRRAVLAVLAVTAGLAAISALSGCGANSGAAVNVPQVAPARTFTLSHFSPATAVHARTPTTISFTVRQPNGAPLTSYKTGSGPHTGVHLIIVRDDLRYIIHEHPPIGPDGSLRQTVSFPSPGPYRVLVDLYPNLPGAQANFQLVRSLTVAGVYHPQRLPAFRADQTIAGYHIDMHGRPALHAIQAAFVDVTVTDPHGRPVHFVPWFGALAHAIFFHAGSLDYFHTHVCAAGAPNCSSALGATRISGRPTAPGKITLGVLLPVPGTWELFLQMRLDGHVVTAPFTLQVAS
jgi:hypothetical protein